MTIEFTPNDPSEELRKLQKKWDEVSAEEKLKFVVDLAESDEHEEARPVKDGGEQT